MLLAWPFFVTILHCRFQDFISLSPETLKYVEELKSFLANGRDELTIPSKEVTASFNLDALKTAASAVMGKQCLGVFLIAEGSCLGYITRNRMLNYLQNGRWF